MSLFAKFRLKKEIESIDLPPQTNIVQTNDKEVILKIQPQSTIYLKEYSFKIVIPDDYPFTSPKITCLNRIFHPNIDIDGNVCLDFLRHKWTSAMGLNWIIYGIFLFFIEPTGENALNTDAGDLLLENKKLFEKKARNYEKKYFN
ncbi:ubiquitin conjugating enzyme E2 [Tubulinosema ratisbonensis]|uniref:Ubiquitin conjugating enzyme E2 n=1 Tax=Tubulinosema ratisbonensis TaxID=291195 RepID=A0A437AK02_9MICR|nr:ubiquitin conjugating enzyme E2 [Tubulinosema ratisbonensis]